MKVWSRSSHGRTVRLERTDPGTLVAAVSMSKEAAQVNSRFPMNDGPAIQIDLEGYQIRHGKRREPLTKTECALLAMLVQHGTRILTRSQILDEVWGSNSTVEDASVDNVIARLRARLRKVAPRQSWIVTVRGKGYRWTGPRLEEAPSPL